MRYTPCNMVATTLVALPLDEDRTYLAVIATTDVGITLSGGEPFTIPAGSVWSPLPSPINDITFTGTGTLVVG